MDEVTLEEIIVQNDCVNVMFDDLGIQFGDEQSYHSYVHGLSYNSCLKNMLMKLIETLGEDAVVGKKLVFNPFALDGVIVRLV